MKVLHYTLGFNPIRTGGLINYVTSLLKSQQQMGIEVVALYPDFVNMINKNTSIKKKNSNDFIKFGIENSLPLPLFGGIKTPKDFIKTVDKDIYHDFLLRIKPDIIHVHSLMGIHKEFFESAISLNIPIVLTSHDYFGLAPEPNFYFDNHSYHNDNSLENWVLASKNALSTKKLRLFQTRMYPLFRKISKKINFKKENDVLNAEFNEDILKDYKNLRKYYEDIFKMISFYHFNSSVSKTVYEKNLNFKINSKILSLSMDYIENNAGGRNEVTSLKENIAYIGPDKDFKGFSEFIKLTNILDSELYNFHTYGYLPQFKYDNITQHGKYKISDLNNIYKNIDYLIVPSLWKETFGLIVLEALSFNTTVIVSENVGAKDIVPKEFRYNKLEEIPSILAKNKKYKINVKVMEQHTEELQKFYQEVINYEY